MKTCKKISTGEIFEYLVNNYNNYRVKRLNTYWYNSTWFRHKEDFNDEFIDIQEERKLKLEKIYESR